MADERTSVLADPWLFDVESEDGTRFPALNALRMLCADLRLQPLPLLPQGSILALLQRLPFLNSRTRSPDLLRFFYQFDNWKNVDGAAYPGPPASVAENLPADLGEEWFKALAYAVLSGGDDWSEPIVLFPSPREPEWPRTSLLTVTAPTTCNKPLCGFDCDCDTATSGLAQLLDPWKRMRLPRPRKVPNGTPIRNLRRVLANVDQWDEKVPDRGQERRRCSYIPPDDWDPTQIKVDAWLENKCFPQGKKRTNNGMKIGPLDRNGRVWAADDDSGGFVHWDVQDPDPRKPGNYDKVGCDGKWIRNQDKP